MIETTPRKKFSMIFFIVMLIALSLPISLAQAGPILLADVTTERVIYEEQASEPWYPASVTKLMTTYLVLQALREGRLSLNTPLKVSAHAAKTPPSNIGFKPSTIVTVDNALKMMLVKSANDVAVILAEGVAGSEAGFVAAMNVEARKLGMRSSYFTNPHGLFDPRQRVTARDLAILALALLKRFPEYKAYYGIGGVKLGKKIYSNTNGLIGRYAGADGMKTGFICASGFNVVATAKRGNRQLIAVVLGERTAPARTIRAAELFDQGFSKVHQQGRLVTEIPPALPKEPSNLRDAICGEGKSPFSDDDNAAAGNPSSNPLEADILQRPRSSVEGPKAGTLIARASLKPTPVFVGLYPGSENAAESENSKKRTIQAIPKKTSLPPIKGSRLPPMRIDTALTPPPPPSRP